MLTRPASPPTIVLVDDDVALRTALTFMLELDGFAVHGFGSGEDLLDGDLPDPPACLVLDYHLSGMTGVEALARVRARGVEIPAVLITSHLSPSMRAIAVALGAAIVEKPLLNDALKAEIDAAIKRQGAA
jgi:FixJ family two-component response regulator